MKFGDCSVPDGQRGPWRVSTFTLSESDVLMGNLRALRDNPIMYCPPGTYRRLSHKARGVVMSNTPMEIQTAREAYLCATGHVFITGLGLGMVLQGILSKPTVKSVKVLEIDPDVISLVGDHFKKDSRVQIIQGDAYEYKPAKSEMYDYVWHDIWDDIGSDNLPLMAKCTRRFSGHAKVQGVWSRELARQQKRRWG